MNTAAIRAAFEQAVAAMTPALPIKFENAELTGSPASYQVATLHTAAPSNDTFGDGFYWEKGFFQVLLCFPENEGTADITARAEAIRTRFKRGTSFALTGGVLRVAFTPTISPGFTADDRYCMAVRMFYVAEASSL